jgi:hypothetical protein
MYGAPAVDASMYPYGAFRWRNAEITLGAPSSRDRHRAPRLHPPFDAPTAKRIVSLDVSSDPPARSRLQDELTIVNRLSGHQAVLASTSDRDALAKLGDRGYGPGRAPGSHA